MSEGRARRLHAFIIDLMRAQAAYTEAKTRGCGNDVLKILSDHMDKATYRVNAEIKEAP